MNKLGCINKKGFSLIELSISVLILTILSSAIVPNFIIGIRQSAAKKIAIEITQIQEAARKYYVDKNSWPANFTTLASGYLDPTWSATNLSPFSKPYIVSVSGQNLIVQTDIPTDVYLVAGANLQMVNYVAVVPATVPPTTTVQSTVTPPGSLSVLPTGTIIPWPTSSLPSGFLWCNGQTVSRAIYSGLFAVIGTTYGVGNGSTTFGLPDSMGRTIVGVDSMGGASAANRISQWGASPATTGGTFGEDAHRQTVSEMAPHAHEEQGYGYGGGSHHPLRFSDSNQTGASDGFVPTMSTGGNGDGSGLGAPSNVVQPSIAMGYIIKT